jgi:uncharacterized protein YcfJ
MNRSLNFTIAVAALALTAQAAQAQIAFYDKEGMHGRVFSTEREVRNFMRVGFNDRASSVIVEHGQWEVCDDADFRGQCRILRRGTYPSLYAMGMNDRITSVRPVAHRERYDNEIQSPPQEQAYEYRRRPNESMFQAPVTSAHAVVGSAEQRCWIERQQVNEPARNSNVGGALVGAVIGGVLGHQVGGGTGRDVATAGGAVAGAVIGANMGNSSDSYAKDVRRCDTVASTTPSYWDVKYNYRGIEHRMQTASAPGPTISVNRDGEPRQ